MPGNQVVFQEALRKAHNLAWDHKWSQAVVEYRRALAEFDTDALVWTSLGAALIELKRLADAKDVFRRASELLPDDISIQQRLAEVYERLGDSENALVAQLQIATILERGPDPLRAAAPWRAILRIQPLHLESRRRLAELFERLGRSVESAQEWATLAKMLHEFGRTAEATEQARKALALDPRNSDARAIIGTLQQVEPPLADASGHTMIEPPAATSDEGGPVLEAARRALSRLADSVFEAAAPAPGASNAIGPLLANAMDLHVRGRQDEAINGYRRALAAGYDEPDIHFAIGMLCLDTLRLDEAVAEFQRTTETPGYDLASHFALGQCSRARRDMPEALRHVLAAYRLLDEEMVSPALIATVSDVYVSVARQREGSTQLIEFADALTEFITVPNWRERVDGLRQQLDAASTPDSWISLAEAVGTGSAERVVGALHSSREYQLLDKPTAASDECYYALAVAPFFLPLHARLAEIFAQQHRVDDAIAKYMAIAAVQQARGDSDQVAATYGRVLTYAPDNDNVRQHLIDVLVARGDIAPAIDQYLALGDVFMRLAQLDRAQKAYEAGLRLVARAGVNDRWTVTALHMIGDIFMQKATWKDALQVYMQVRRLVPDDDKASLRLVDLYFKLGRAPETENELAHLISLYDKRGDSAKLIPMVADMASMRPRSTALKNFLIDLLIRAGRTEQAIGELDTLGEAQLLNHQTTDAILTIERIIALKPAKVEEYQKLLAQLRAGA
ncbi:MAG: tetratricopeptide repeat protein [Chloroflexi bacterium]|nr:tetratricopeptide repeat protein [Chloroflexota bacterium]